MKTNKPYKIFIVEDNIFFAECVAKHLVSEGYIVHTFINGENMLQQIKINPDVIILDYYLDQKGSHIMNGREILSEIRKTHKQTPVVFLSVEDDIELVIQLLKTGASDYVLKDENVFLNLIKSLATITQVLELRKQIDSSKGNIISGIKRMMVYFTLLFLMFISFLFLQ